MSELQERLDLALRLAWQGAAFTLRYYQSPELAVDWKIDATPVTQADRGGEELIRQALASECPGDAIVGEEFGTQEGSTGYRWYLDPVDGTQSFLRGVPLFGTMIGLEREGEAVAGVIAFPALREIVYGSRGMGSWWAVGVDPTGLIVPVVGARRAHVSAVSRLVDASVSTTSIAATDWGKRRTGLDTLLARAGLFRGWSDCYGHYLVATGRLDVMLDPGMSVWDNAALQPIIEEAGGRFTDMAGVPTIHGDSAVSTNGLLHPEVVGLLSP